MPTVTSLYGLKTNSGGSPGVPEGLGVGVGEGVAVRVGVGVGVGVSVGVAVGVGVGVAPHEPSDVHGWPVPVTPLCVAGSSPRVHQFAR
jgi:hypothetical protein